MCIFTYICTETHKIYERDINIFLLSKFHEQESSAQDSQDFKFGF